MIEQFVTYNIARRLKDNGFTDKCLAYYGVDYGNGSELVHEMCNNDEESISRRNFITAPLWQQTINWIRNRYQINIIIQFDYVSRKWVSLALNINITNEEYQQIMSSYDISLVPKYDTYEEAREDVINNILTYLNFTP